MQELSESSFEVGRKDCQAERGSVVREAQEGLRNRKCSDCVLGLSFLVERRKRSVVIDQYTGRH